MNHLLILITLILSPGLSANSTVEEKIFSILGDNGVFMKKSHIESEIELDNLTCRRQRGSFADCTYIDAARPYETGVISGHSAEFMFKELVVSGVKTIHLFGEEIFSVETLRCRSLNNTRGDRDIEVSCQRLRRLID